MHRINPKKSERIGVFNYFQGQFHIFKGNFTKFQDNSRTNGTILKFQEFLRTKVKFKDFSRSVRTLYYVGAIDTNLSAKSTSRGECQRGPLVSGIYHMGSPLEIFGFLECQRRNLILRPS